MSDQTGGEGLSLYDAARAMGVTVAEETAPGDRVVQANGLSFHYLDWGSLDSPPVLLLHGFAQTCHSWDFVSLSLSDRFRVIALDQRGHGDTQWAADGDYSADAYQSDIHAVVEALGLTDLVLIGLSMGGRNAFTYAATHPEKTRALVIVDSAPETRSAGTSNITRFVQQDDELDSIDDFVERVRKYNTRRPVEQIRGSIRHNVKQLPSGKWTWKYDRRLRTGRRSALPGADLVAQLWGHIESLQCPTLVVRGGQSDVVDQDTAAEMVRRMPDGRLATVDGAGHLVMGDNPAGFERAVTAFLTELV